jgi:metal-responsive CopG/Arc/MetJ family transcriptional regulator
MSRRTRLPDNVKMRRTTLTLPVDLLNQALRIARNQKVTLSTVIAEALSEGLRRHVDAKRSEEVLDGYRKAFSGFSKKEIAILDGVILEPPTRH